jgi:hypothetical protein
MPSYHKEVKRKLMVALYIYDYNQFFSNKNQQTALNGQHLQKKVQ